MMATELYPKRLQLLKEVTPDLRQVAVLWNPDHSFHARVVEQLKAVAPSLSLELSSAPVRMAEEFGRSVRRYRSYESSGGVRC